MIPYIAPPSLELGPVSIPAFTLLALTAVVVGFEIVVRRAPRIGLEANEVASLVGWTILMGLLASHAIDTLAYYPERAVRDPLELLRIWNGMSSFGGMLGGVGTASFLMWRRGWSRDKRLTFIDGLAFAFPFAWIFGRLGCALAHDHLGVASSHFLAVRFPQGPRLDLGLLELLVTLPIAALFLALDRKPRRPPFFLGLFFAIYGPIRFALDALRVQDVRYLGWTPGQYASIVVTFLAVVLLLRWTRAERRAVPQRPSRKASPKLETPKT